LLSDAVQMYILKPKVWNPEDGDSMLVRNVGIYLGVRTAL
jgi:hypothetical protein